jgi:hypothetical protein
MNSWVFVIGAAGVIVLWFIFKRLYLDPAEREQSISVEESMERQAQKRNGRVHLSGGQPTLTLPHRNVNIDLSLITNDDEMWRECSFATFRVDHFNDKHFLLALNSKDIFLKPFVVGTRVEVPDEQFKEAYVITGNDTAFVNNVLTQEIRDKLRKECLQIVFGRRLNAPILNREKGWLSVFTKFMSTGDDVFDGLIETAILFHDRLVELNTDTENAQH